VGEIDVEKYSTGGFKLGVSALAISKDGNTLYIADHPNILIWDLKGKNLRAKLTAQPGQLHSLALSPDENYLYSGSGSGRHFKNILGKWNLKKIGFLHEKGEQP
jgi:WD40 repeat protein